VNGSSLCCSHVLSTDLPQPLIGRVSQSQYMTSLQRIDMAIQRHNRVKTPLLIIIVILTGTTGFLGQGFGNSVFIFLAIPTFLIDLIFCIVTIIVVMVGRKHIKKILDEENGNFISAGFSFEEGNSKSPIRICLNSFALVTEAPMIVVEPVSLSGEMISPILLQPSRNDAMSLQPLYQSQHTLSGTYSTVY